ncbi:hypothetical protein [Niabella aurantiaca]|uniref:hypothetical protein n=1 Tax=Niabella aurantiaca TaxID=379900 RepID=UPI000379DA5A|nr:hypothetical protein [Niabella aurantiaca]
MRKSAALSVLTLFSLLSFNFQCGKDRELPAKQEKPIIIEIPLRIYPVKKAYAVGDTIWIEAALSSKTLPDVKNKTAIRVDTVRFDIPFIYKVLTKQTLVPPGGFCQFINPLQLPLSVSSGYYDPQYNVYWNYNTGTVQHFSFKETGYQFKIGIRLNTRGAFYIGLSGSLVNSIIPGNNQTANQYASFRFETPDVNQDVYNDLPKLSETNPYWIGFDMKTLTENKAFVVRVD